MFKKLTAVVRPAVMSPAQRRVRLVFWFAVIGLGVAIWFD